jgi:hypothetical protein
MKVRRPGDLAFLLGLYKQNALLSTIFVEKSLKKGTPNITGNLLGSMKHDPPGMSSQENL